LEELYPEPPHFLIPIFGSLSTEIEDMCEFLLLVGKLRVLDDHCLIRFNGELYAADAAERGPNQQGRKRLLAMDPGPVCEHRCA